MTTSANNDLDPGYKEHVNKARDLFYTMASDKEMSFKKKRWGESPFDKFIKFLSSYEHSYDTICHAVAAAALAAAKCMNRQPCGGITGYQASFVMWQFVGQWMHYGEAPLKLVNYEQMLFPQAADKLAQVISADTWQYLQEQAKLRLEGELLAHEQVRAHWASIVAGTIPFGYTLAAVDA